MKTPTGRFVVIMGVRVRKADVPIKNREPVDFKLTNTSLGILRDIAVSYTAGLPIIISGDSGIGKTAALKKFGELIGAHIHMVNVNEETAIKQLMSRLTAVGNGFTYVDGPITQAMRARPGELHIVVLDEVNTMRSEQTAGLHGILDAWQDGRPISTGKVLQDGNTEMLQFPRGRVYFAMTMNPTGKGYHGRKLIDDALARRSHLSQYERADQLQMKELRDIELGKEIKIDGSVFLYSRAVPLTKQELMKDKDYEPLHNAYIRFHETIIQKINSRELGRGQSEGTYFGGIDMNARMHSFLQNFHTPENGTLTEVFQKALLYFYVQPFMKKEDRDRVREMVIMFAKEDEKAPEVEASKPAPAENVYHRPPNLKFAFFQGKGTLRDVNSQLRGKSVAGVAEFKYVKALAEKHNAAINIGNLPAFTKEEKDFLSRFKENKRIYNFFGGVNAYGIPFVRYFKQSDSFKIDTQRLGAKWDPVNDCAVMMG